MSEVPLGTSDRPLRVAVVGSGPSAFYAVEALFKAERLYGRVGFDCRVDVFDRLPTPFGLVRGGVAPDHQKIKEVVRVYDEIASDPRFRFFGNVTVGRDLTVTDLESLYDRVIWAVGNESERHLDVPGEDFDGVHSATAFVGWYNGHPDHAGRQFALEGAERVVVVGNGNVAMDVSRILLRDPAELAATDIAEHALAALRRSTVREVILLGRRGPAQAAFAPKEIKEIDACEGVEVAIDPAELELDAVTAAWLEEAAPKSAQKNLAFLEACAARGVGGAPRRVTCVFRASPVEILGRGGRVCGVRVERNDLVADADGTPRPKGRGEFFEVAADLVFKAVGYRGVPVDGVPFCNRRGVIPNHDGRVLQRPGGEVLPRHYVVGWAKRGPTGLIGTNSPDSKATVQSLVDDLGGATAAPLGVTDAERTAAILDERGVAWVDWSDWQRYEAFERAEGTPVGKVRAKQISVEAILTAMRGLRGA